MKVVKVRNEKELLEVLNSDEFDDCTLFEQFSIPSNDDEIVTEGLPFYIEDIELLVIEGVYYIHNLSEEYADFSLTLVYKWNPDKLEFTEDDAKNYEYFEQDPPITALHNYLQFAKESL